MNTMIKLGVVLLCLVFGSGCGAFKETWAYETSTAARVQQHQQTRQAEKRKPSASCATPLRVAVRPFADERLSDVRGTEGMIAARLMGIVMGVPWDAEWDYGPGGLAEAKAQWVHDERRVFAMALWSELSDSGCFAEVAFDPLDETQYDLVFDGSIRRLAQAKKTWFVPVPLYVGMVISEAAPMRTVVEIDVSVRRPGGKQPMIKYGLRGGCSDCSENRFVDGVLESLRNGHADFVTKLSEYLASRSKSYWKAVQSRRADQRRAALDPEHARLARAVPSLPAAAAEIVRAKVETKAERLDAIDAVDARRERAWASTSRARVRAEIMASNTRMEDAHASRVRAAIFAGLMTAGQSAATGRSLSPRAQATVQERATALSALFDTNGAMGSFLEPAVHQKVARLVKEHAQAAQRRGRELERYRRETGSADEVVARAKQDADVAAERARLAEANSVSRPKRTARR
ncbi:MAG: hypothetical protein IT377_16400 [Polyangiaceae bacterium]|nr:hypothetical protein [Polyangiaceae bacterium]